MSFDPDAYLAATEPAPAPAAAFTFDPDAFLAEAPALRDPNAPNTTRSTVTGFTAAEAQARGEQGAAGFAAVGNDALQLAPTALRIAGPTAAVAAGAALAVPTGGLSLPVSMLLAGGGSLAAEPLAQTTEKALGQRENYSVAEGAINVAAGTIPGVRFANRPLASAATRAVQILTRAGQGAAQTAAQDIGTRYVRGEDDVYKTAGQSALIGAGFGGLIGTAFDELARKITLDRMFTTARQAGFAGESVDDLRQWWQGPPAGARPQAGTAHAPSAPGTGLIPRPQVLDLEVMPPAGRADPIIPAADRPLALPPSAVPRDVLRLMPGSGPLALPAPMPEPAAPIVGTQDRPENQVAPRPARLPVAVDPVAPATSGPNLPAPASAPPSATAQSLPANQPPEPLAAATPTTLPEPVASNETPTAAVPLPGAEQPAAPTPDVKPAPRPYAKLTPAELKAKIKSLTDGIAKPSQTATRVAKLTKDLASYQAEAALRRAEKAASGKGKGRGFGIGPDARGDEDLLNAVEAAGGIRTRGDNTGGESDGFAREASGIIRLLRRKDAPEITTMLGELADDFGYRFDTVSDFEQALERAVATRKRTAQLVEAEKQTELFRRAALENKGRGGTDPAAKPIAPGKITEGDTFKVKGEPVKVAAIDPETDTITLKDGECFGTQEVPAGVPIYADAKTYKPAPADKAGLKWGDVAKERDARIKAETEAGTQDWEAIYAANQAEAAAAVDGTPAPVESIIKATLTPADREWFKGSKVVDSTGNPLVVFRGEWKARDKLRDGVDVFLTSSPEIASEYAMADNIGGAANVMPVVTRLQNPLVVDAKNGEWNPIIPLAIEEAKAAGRDGLIVHNVRDGIGAEIGRPATTYVVFDSKDIRSAFGSKPAAAALSSAPIPRGKAQTVDMFDSGAAGMDFTMAGETTADATGNMDRMAQAAADKAAAEAAQGGLFSGKLGAASGAAHWAAVLRIIDPQSVLPEEVHKAVRFGTQAVTGHLVRAKDNQADLIRALKGAQKTTPNVVALTRAFLDGTLPITALPVPVREPARAIRTHIDALTERAVREGVVTGPLATTLLDNMGKYLRRSYKILEDATAWKATREYQIARRNWIAYLLTQPNPAAIGALYTRTEAETLTNQLTDRDSAASFMIGGKVAGRDVSSLIKRKDLLPELRALYGEITDPIEAYGQTIPRLARLVENHAAQQWIKLIGLRTGIFDTSPTPLNHRPLVSENNQPHEVWQGLYTQPVIARALEREVTTSPRAFSAFESFFKVVRTLTGVSKMTKTVLNPDSYAPNFIGGIITTLANGNYNLLHTGRGFQLAAEELGILRAAGILPTTRAGLKDDLAKLAKLGLRSEGLDAADLLKTWERSLLPQILGKTGRGIQTALSGYGQIDNATKYLSWKCEIARLKKWMPPGTPLETLERIAAERVRATTQVYGQVPKIITDLSQLGIAPSFVSFTWELFRNTANTARIGWQDFNEGRKTGNKAQQWDGARRIASLIVVVGAGLGINELSRREQGISDDQDDAVRYLGPKYDENASLHYNTPIKDGRVNITNTSYLLPHMLLTEAIMTGKRGDDGEEQIKLFLNQLRRQFMAADLGVFVGPSLEALIGYRRDNGLPVYNPESPTAGLDALGYVADRSLTPLMLRKVENYVKAAHGEVSPSGKVFSASDENWRLLGSRQQTRDLRLLAEYKARDLSRRWLNANLLYTQLRGRNMPAEDIEAGYQRAAQARQRIADEMKNQYFRLGLVAGLSEDELIKNLRAGQGLSAEELLGVIDGKYVDQPRDRQQSAVQVLDRAKRLPEEKRMAAVAAEIVRDPKLVKGIMREVETLSKGITQQDRLVLALDVADGSRARYIANQITTGRIAPAQLPAYLEAAKRKSILTDAVYQQLKTGSWRDLDQ
jgi:hypothetical protein